MRVLLGAVGELAGTEATPENAEDAGRGVRLSAARMLGAVIRHTTNPTMLDAGYKVNVVPGQATAQVDGRFLPGLEDDFLATLRELAGPDVDIEFITKMHGLETPYDGEMADAMTASILEEDPDALVAPYLMSGGTDAKHFTELGHALPSASRRCGCPTSSTSPPCSTASTSGCRWTRSSSAPGSSTGSSGRSEASSDSSRRGRRSAGG